MLKCNHKCYRIYKQIFVENNTFYTKCPVLTILGNAIKWWYRTSCRFKISLHLQLPYIVLITHCKMSYNKILIVMELFSLFWDPETNFKNLYFEKSWTPFTESFTFYISVPKWITEKKRKKRTWKLKALLLSADLVISCYKCEHKNDRPKTSGNVSIILEIMGFIGIQWNRHMFKIIQIINWILQFIFCKLIVNSKTKFRSYIPIQTKFVSFSLFHSSSTYIP